MNEILQPVLSAVAGKILIYNFMDVPYFTQSFHHSYGLNLYWVEKN
jgi:hypothetical protein